MQFMNSSLENLVKNLSDNDFKYFSSENLELLKQKDACPFEYIDSFKEKKCLIKNVFISSAKDGTTGDNGKKLDGHMSDEDY